VTFETTVWLLLAPLLALCVAAILLFGSRRRDTLLTHFAAARLLPQLTERADSQRVFLKSFLITFAVLAVGIALARPQFGVEWTERKSRGLDIVFVLDSSKSMLATDLRPTRLERAKLAIRDLVNQLESDRIGLVAFAGRAFLQTPPTLDYAAFSESLDSVEPGIMSRGGSDIGNALLEAAKAFPAENNFKAVVLLTDGEDLGGEAMKAAKQAGNEGIRVYSIGIGTPEGEYLRILNENGKEEFVRDSSGQPIRSQLDEATLSEIAQITGGSYTRLSDQSLNALYSSVIAMLPRSERESEMQEIRLERFQWPLAIAVIVLILESLIRRRSSTKTAFIVCLGGLLSISTPAPSQAQEATPPEIQAPEPQQPRPTDPRLLYNQGTEALNAGDFETAESLFSDAIKRSNDHQIQRDALYNQAHSVNQRAEAAFSAQELEPAIELWKESENLFNSAQEIDPTDSRAGDNASMVANRRTVLEEFLEQQKPPESEENEESEDGEQSEDGESSEDESGDKGEQDNQESEQGEDEKQDSNSSEENSDSESEESQSGEESDSESEGEQSKQDSESGSGSEESEQGEDSQNTGENNESSTEDPVDDIPQPGEEESEEEGSAPSPGEASEGEEGALPEGTQVLQGMSEADAQALLDSIQNSERQLPFVDQTTPAKKRDIRDW